MAEHTLIVYPNFISALGGAQSARIGVRYAWITLADGRVLKMPAKLAIEAASDGGISLALAAESYQRDHA